MRLYSIITPLSENNDDMFPGVSSSVFDDAKAKDQPEHDTNDKEWVQEQLTRYHEIRMVYSKKRENIMADMSNNGAREYIGHAPPPSNAISYASFDWSHQYNIPGLINGYAIEKSSPYLKDIESTVKVLQGYYDRENFFRNKSTNFSSALKRIRAQEKKSVANAAGVEFGTYAKNVSKMNAPYPIPHKLPVANKRPINNPYVTANATKQYAGSVFHYPHWSAYWKTQIMTIEAILKRNGKKGLEMMYASTHNNGGARFNFVIEGANGKLTWRKYDPSPGAGQNWIILNGNKMNTSTLLGADKSKQDKAVQLL
jgi:hypothetical protein